MLDADGDKPGVPPGFFFGRADGLVDGVAFERTLALGDGVEGSEVFAQPPPAHGALFEDAVPALGQDVGFALFRQEFYADFGPGVFPFAIKEIVFQCG